MERATGRLSRRHFVQGMAVLGLATGTPASLKRVSANNLSIDGSWIEVNGAQLYYEVRGTGPAVLFIPGATGDAGHFDQVADALADAFTVVTYDRRGRGESTDASPWAPEREVEDLRAVSDAAATERPGERVAVHTLSSGAVLAWPPPARRSGRCRCSSRRSTLTAMWLPRASRSRAWRCW